MMSVEPGGSLAGRVAFVTGSGRNLGRAVALRLAAAGADVAVHVRSNREEGERVAEEVRDAGRRAVLVTGDVSKPEEVTAMFDEVEATFGRLDVFVNNVGVRPHAMILDIDVETWNWVIDVSLNGAFYCAKAAAHVMVRAGNGGSIVNVTGSAAVMAKEGRAHVIASKAALQGLTRAMAKELGGHGIRANSVAPVNLEDTSRPAHWYPGARNWDDASHIPLQRFGTSEDIADVIVFLAGDASRYLTGQALHVNGGAYMV